MSLIKRSYKYRMYPNKTQEELLAHSDAYVLYGMLVLTHLTHTIKKQTLIRNSRQSRILLKTLVK